MTEPATRPLLRNAAARRLFLHRHELGTSPKGSGKGADLLSLIRALGFVQVDSVNTLARAHDMILFARRPAYRPGNLAPLIERDRALFEHWTHDAAIIPVEFLPYLRLRFARDAARMQARWPRWQGEAFLAELQQVRDHVAQSGEVCSADLKSAESEKSTGWWDWHPSKAALEYLWRSGEMAISRRQSFRKYYDLVERVHGHPEVLPDAICLDWLNSAALDRLGFATSGELAAFWDIATPAEARSWCQKECAAGRLQEIDIENCDGGLRRAFARPGAIEEAAALPEVPSRLRVLSPFDPALRDRNRAERLFGFRYRIEIFVPEAKREYGYYVFPLMERDRMVGRVDMKADRDAGVLNVTRLWPERGVTYGVGRLQKLASELDRVARFAGVDQVSFGPDWLAEAK
ncbi:winged helix-turn-helix domain-containing protein [Pseudooceanicola sediminis]|uniref:Winged helix-turn-helix domain-containing protein n=1 Tax=Pseudooceanicola sediminis TaxID=2211117 RepID=A0A399IXB6_9RHOB|nr:crosslink repair DNA glycosylase YcaQ family protein [Pseudooceanicola sediminis]KAA2312980.1 winged helix-turn-helix domain-containing protein [Puniceibacterium sp. HSS470]RII37620.1 winged helix-turn-helix domain-containing protein [Pseudooceanicola sediminis]|tara:strand:- start:21642 stop:22853 length:1212 start_codon:yes stop_codon:yes gene_type:complete